MLISEICDVLHSISPTKDIDIQWLLTDSRSLAFPDKTLFFALRTKRNDGHKYISELYHHGVRHFVVSQSVCNDDMPEAFFIQVTDTLKALQMIAEHHRSAFRVPVIGITGSNGKTIIKEWLNQLLRDRYKIVRSPRSYNSQIGVPLSVWQMDTQTEIGIFEAGISKPQEMQRLEPIIRPTIGIFSNIGDAHQENFTSLKQKCEEKLQLFEHADLVIYNEDNETIAQAMSSFADKHPKANRLTWGKSPKAKIKILSINTDLQADLTYIKYEYQQQVSQYILPFTDQASVENSLHCLAVMLCLHYDQEQIASHMMQLERVELRLNVKEGQHDCIIIDDSYNSDLASLQIALDTLDRQADVKGMGRTLVLTDIAENGQPEDLLYQHIADLLQNRHGDHLVGIGQQLSNHASRFHIGDMYFYKTTTDFIQSGIWKNWERQVILLKGARHFQLEKFCRQFERIAHETILEVNLSALIHNFNYYRGLIKPKTKICCMVKAFAYGTGSVEVAKALQHNHCDYMAVAVADEGAELRAEGIHTPIIVMAPEHDALSAIIEYNLEPNIHNFSILQAFISEVERQGITSYPIHIKIDSGMHRLGFEFSDMDLLIERLNRQSAVTVRSVFSHLAGADEEQFDSFTHEQIKRYTACADRLQAGLSYPVMRHILNSAGIERFNDYQMDMVRLGIGLYGTSFIPGKKLQNVCTLKSIILQVKTVKAGESIGYGRRTMLTEDRRIAVIPIGYADGLDRRLGNRVGHVIVNGIQCPIVGNICMDQTMIDVTKANAREGDTAIIFGDEQPVEQIAAQLQTINYEVLTGISRRIKRIYYQE
ncbi:MAG: bifunctional UDP-N-acetylmuramoyl-tripeptide:D-alanyl-D-alanine ligase/alanine racemase [Paludibacteraceae bacterium]|nr:bifunctional UDP-N-acetylmuramoyl-tripeptide:D-alanyl-D-alanine ligase/alanine racemase [Paludibacteraceae bacterium]